jgi:integrase
LARFGEAIREAETTGIPWEVDGEKPTAKHVAKEKNRRTLIGLHAAAALRLLILTGARLREILTLRWEWVDLERGLLLLPDSKTGRKCIVLNAPAMPVLSALPRFGAYVIAGDIPRSLVLTSIGHGALYRSGPTSTAFEFTAYVTPMPV